MATRLNGRAVVIIVYILSCFTPFIYILGGASLGMEPASAESGSYVYHALLESTAVIIAVIVTAAAVCHYLIRRQAAIFLFGLAFLSVAVFDLLQTIAVADPGALNQLDQSFLPLTWALSRALQAVIMICAVAVGLVLLQNKREYVLNRTADTKVSIGLGFIAAIFAYLLFQHCAASQSLPKALFSDAWIPRPFDVLPLGLFVLLATLLWLQLKRDERTLNLLLFLSAVPAIGMQLHAAFGALALIDVHFYAAQVLKIIFATTVLVAVVYDLIVDAKQNELALDTVDDASKPNLNALPVGKAKRPIAVMIPLVAFLIAATVTVAVSTMSYIENKRLLKKRVIAELSHEEDLIATRIENLYENAASDAIFLSSTPPINAIISALYSGNEQELEVWKKRLEVIFSQFLISKMGYLKIQYVQVADSSIDIVKAARLNSRVHIYPTSRMREREVSGFLSVAMRLNPGEVYFSDVELNREDGVIKTPHQSITKVATPIFDPVSGDIFGVVIISIDFGKFVESYLRNEFIKDQLIIASGAGDIVYHPDPSKRFGHEFGRRYLIQEEYSLDAKIISKPVRSVGLNVVSDADGNRYAGSYGKLVLDHLGEVNLFHILVLDDRDKLLQELSEFQNRSLMIGFSLAIVAFAFAILASRRVSRPIAKMVESINSYNESNKAIDLPIDSQDEIGIMARSFHNMLAQIDSVIRDQKQAAARLEAILNNAADAIVTIDSNGNILSFNKAAERIFGYSYNEISGKEITLIIPNKPVSQEHVFSVDHLRESSKEVLGAGNELQGRRKNGERFPMHLSFAEVITEKDLIFTGIIRDISRSKQRENQLNEARKYIDGIINAIPVLLSYVDNNRCYRFANKNYERWFDVKVEELVGKNIQDTLGPQAHQRLLPHIDAALSGETTSFDLELVNAQGNLRQLHATYTPDISLSGEVQGFFVSVEDITEARLKEEQLTELSNRLEFALTAPGIGVWDYNLISGELIWDKRMYQLYGIKPEDFSGAYEAWEAGLHSDDLEYARKSLAYAAKTGGVFNSEFRVCWPNGEIHHIEAHAQVLSNSVGEFVRMIGTNVDITEKKIRDRDLECALAKAEDSAKLKSEFLASMSHEIRTPMNGVLGMLGLLRKDNLSDTQLHKVKLAYNSAQSLLTLINDILDFSKIEAKKLDLEKLDFNLPALLGDFSESIAAKAQDKGLELILDFRGVKHSIVRGDSGRLRQILSNLVGNAIKFTESGEIVLQTTLIDNDDHSFTLRCSVTDSGIGIRPDKQRHIFDSFTQEDSSTTRNFGGTGLGLAIVKQLCQLMGGDIYVESEVGRGSTFYFNIQLEASDQSELTVPEVEVGGRRMLIVDDNATNREVLQGQLNLWDVPVAEVEGAEKALSLLAECSEDEMFEIAFIDYQMPKVNGLELGKKIRANPKYDSMKLVMMTSITTHGEAHIFKEAGFDAFFPKPVTLEDLNAAIILLANDDENKKERAFITDKFTRGLLNSSVADVTNKFPPNCRLLLVEDNPINQEVIRCILEDVDLQCDYAGNGVEALEALQFTEDEFRYDLVLMDCQMPEMDGFETTKAIRNGRAGNVYIDIPIIAMTANAMKGDKERCIEAGMNDYLSKPVEERKLLNTILNWLSKEELKHKDEPREMPEFMTWNQQKFLDRIRGRADRAIRLMDSFMNQFPLDLDMLVKQIADKNYDEISKTAHTLKGVAANLSAEQLAEDMLSIEKACTEQLDQELDSYALEIKAHFQTLEKHLNEYRSQL